MFGQGASFLLHMGSTVVLARLLTPQDYGLIGMVTAVTGFVAMFKDMGLSMATVQKAEINHGQISTLFWINVLLSFGVMLVTAALAPAIAWFYGEPRLTWITLALASAFIFGGFTVQHQALLRRNMRFGTLAFIHIASILAGIVVAFIAAWYGLRYWALVLMQVATAIAGAIAVWVVCPWRPSLPVRRSGVRKMLAFGANLTGFSFLNYFARNLDNVLIGKVWGTQPLGFYSKAYGLLMLPLGQITAPIAAVAVPALSRLQDDPERYRRYYYRAISTIAFITMPLIAMLAALSHEIIRIVLGDQWISAAPIFKVLAFAAVLQPVVNPVGWVFVSLGQADRQLRWAIVAVPLIVLSFVLGLPWGAFGVAVSYTLCSLTVLTFPALWWTFRLSPLSIRGWLNSIRCPLVASSIMYLTIEILRHYLTSYYKPLSAVFLLGAVGVSCFLVAIAISRTGREEAYAAWRLLRHLQPNVTV